MATRKPTQTEILDRLHLVEVLMAEGEPLARALRLVGMTEVGYARARTEYGGLLHTLGPTWSASRPRRPHR
jgi:putative transposase